MDPQIYLVRQIDGTVFELTPSGELLIWQPGAHEPITLPATTAYSLYLFLFQPGVRPALRRLDDERQRQAWQARRAA